MNHRKIEDALNRAIKDAPLLNVDKLLEMPVVKMEEEDYITRQQNTKKTTRKTISIGKLSLIASFCLIMVVILTSWIYQVKKPDTMITLDINPSIQIILNKQNKVLKVEALNDDAKAFINNYNFKTKDLNAVVKELIQLIYDNGYLDLTNNTILVSVENKNQEKIKSVSDYINDVLEVNLKEQKIPSYILIQTLSKSDDITGLAKQYGVSEGKMQLIYKLNSLHSTLSLEYLADLNMEELLLLADENKIDVEDIIDSYHYYKNSYEEQNDSDKDDEENGGDDSRLKTEYDEDGDKEDNLDENYSDVEDNHEKDSEDQEEDDQEGQEDHHKNNETYDHNDEAKNYENKKIRRNTNLEGQHDNEDREDNTDSEQSNDSEDKEDNVESDEDSNENEHDLVNEDSYDTEEDDQHYSEGTGEYTGSDYDEINEDDESQYTNSQSDEEMDSKEDSNVSSESE